MFRVLLDSMESSLSLESNYMLFKGIRVSTSENMIVVPRVKPIGIHDKKRIRYEQELAIEVDLICRVISAPKSAILNPIFNRF